MSIRQPAHYPITSVCIVADPQKCPPNYELLMKSHDRKEDCDLWRESGLMRTPKRYLCFTRAFPSPNGHNQVLTGLAIINEKDISPTDFTILGQTIDTGDKGMRKKIICLKMTSREATKEALTDIILLTKSKRAPEGYTYAGDIHGVGVCFKQGVVPLETQTFTHASSTPATQPAFNHARPAPLPPISGYPAPAVQPQTYAPVPTLRGLTIKRADSILHNPLHDVPFQLNPKHQDNGAILKNNGPIPMIQYRSLVDIENEFSYSFTTERSTTQQRR